MESPHDDGEPPITTTMLTHRVPICSKFHLENPCLNTDKYVFYVLYALFWDTLYVRWVHYMTQPNCNIFLIQNSLKTRKLSNIYEDLHNSIVYMINTYINSFIKDVALLAKPITDLNCPCYNSRYNYHNPYDLLSS